MQHHARHARHRDRARAPAAQPRGQPVLHLRSRPHELPVDEPRRPDRGTARQAGRRAPGGGLGRGLGACGYGAAGGERQGRGARVAEGLDRSAVPCPRAIRRARLDRRRADRDGRGGAARRGPQPGAPRRAAPNGTGAELLGYGRDYAAALKAAESAAVVLVLDEPEVTVRTAGVLIYVGTVLPDGARDAKVVLPVANVAEEDGSFVNRDGRAQRYLQAKR